jgi:hypothetical protein
MPSTLERVIIRLTPQFLYDMQCRRRQLKADRDIWSSRSAKEAFTKIYEHGYWGQPKGEPDKRYYSGIGSHHPEWVAAYVSAVQHFIESLGYRPNAVDLGCGDFAVGSRIRGMCDRYVACDIVDQVIEDHKVRYASLDVDFRALNIIEDNLPDGDIAFVRQVLQHLSNKDISKVAPQLAKYKYVIFTEGLPAGQGWRPNVDKPIDRHIRLNQGSGVVLTEPPFSLHPIATRTICCVQAGPGEVIKTDVLAFPPADAYGRG